MKIVVGAFAYNSNSDILNERMIVIVDLPGDIHEYSEVFKDIARLKSNHKITKVSCKCKFDVKWYYEYDDITISEPDGSRTMQDKLEDKWVKWNDIKHCLTTEEIDYQHTTMHFDDETFYFSMFCRSECNLMRTNNIHYVDIKNLLLEKPKESGE